MIALRRLAPLLLPLLAACAAPQVNVPGAPAVRHAESTRPYPGGGRWHLFFFQPQQARSLDDRIALARAAIAREPGCRWIDAPRDELAERTLDQGTRYADTVLAAPLRCRD
ncbi:MAG: hypothetical protein ACU0AT_06860 [Tranquillimonas sp.]